MNQEMKKLENQKGFTLIEIIAVLIIIGILAAVAVPRFINLQNDARQNAAQGAIAEIKAVFNTVYGQILLQNNGNVALATAAAINTAAAIPQSPTAYGDFTVTTTDVATGGANGHGLINIAVLTVQTVAITPGAVTDTWDVP